MAIDKYFTFEGRRARRKLINAGRGIERRARQKEEKVTENIANRRIIVEKMWYVWSEEKNNIKEEPEESEEEQDGEERIR